MRYIQVAFASPGVAIQKPKYNNVRVINITSNSTSIVSYSIVFINKDGVEVSLDQYGYRAPFIIEPFMWTNIVEILNTSTSPLSVMFECWD